MSTAVFTSHRSISEHFSHAAYASTALLPNVTYATRADPSSSLEASVRFSNRRLDACALRCAVEVLQQEEVRERMFLRQRYSEEQRSFFMTHFRDFHVAVIHYAACHAALPAAAARGPAEECSAQAKQIAAWSAVLKLIAAQKVFVPLQCP